MIIFTLNSSRKLSDNLYKKVNLRITQTNALCDTLEQLYNMIMAENELEACVGISPNVIL